MAYASLLIITPKNKSPVLLAPPLSFNGYIDGGYFIPHFFYGVTGSKDLTIEDKTHPTMTNDRNLLLGKKPLTIGLLSLSPII